jgi:hypothetical protein
MADPGPDPQHAPELLAPAAAAAAPALAPVPAPSLVPVSAPAAATAQLVAAAGPLPNDTVQALSTGYVPPLREAVIQLRALLSGSAAAREDIFRFLLLFRTRQGELRTAYAERYGRDLAGDLNRMPDPDDRIRAHRYLTEGGLRLADYLYFYPSNVAWVIASAGADPAAWRSTIEQQLDEGFRSGLYDADRRRTGRLPDGTTDSLAAGLFDQLAVRRVRDAAKSLYTFGTEPPALDQIHNGLIAFDLDLFFKGLRAYFGAGGATEQRLTEQLRDTYGDDLRVQLDPLIRDRGDAQYRYRLIVAGELTVAKRVEIALATGNVQELFETLTSADQATRAALRNQLNADTRISRLFHDWFNGLDSDQEARVEALLEDPALVDPAIHRIRGLGGADGEALVRAAQFSMPDDFTVLQIAYKYGTRFYDYIGQHTHAAEQLRFEAVVEPDLDHRIGNAILVFHNPAYLLHLLRHFVTDETTRARLRADSGLLGSIAGSERDEAMFLLAPSAADQPLERAVWTVRQIARERSVLADWRAVGSALSDAARELRATAERAVTAPTSAVRAAEIARLGPEQTRVERIRTDYVVARDTLAWWAKTIIQQAAFLILDAATAGALTPAWAEMTMVQIARVALVGAASRLAADLAVERNLTREQLKVAFVAGAAQGVIDLVGAAAAEHLMAGVRAGAAAGYEQSGDAIQTALRYGQAGLTNAVGAAVEVAVTDRTWVEGTDRGLAALWDAIVAAGGTGVAFHGGVHLGGALLSGPRWRPPPEGPPPMVWYDQFDRPTWISGRRELPPQGPFPELITSTGNPPRPDVVILGADELPMRPEARPKVIRPRPEPARPAPDPLFVDSRGKPLREFAQPRNDAFKLLPSPREKAPLPVEASEVYRLRRDRSDRPTEVRQDVVRVLADRRPSAAPKDKPLVEALKQINDPELARAVGFAYDALRNQPLIADVVAEVLRHAEQMQAPGQPTVTKTLIGPPGRPGSTPLTLRFAKPGEAFLAALLDLSERAGGRPVTLLGGATQFKTDNDFFARVAGRGYRFLDASALLLGDEAWTHGAATHLLQDLVVDRKLAAEGLSMSSTDLRRRLPGIPGDLTFTAGSAPGTKPSGQWIWEGLWDDLEVEPSNPNHLNPLLRPLIEDIDAPLATIDPRWQQKLDELVKTGRYRSEHAARNRIYRRSR